MAAMVGHYTPNHKSASRHSVASILYRSYLIATITMAT